MRKQNAVKEKIRCWPVEWKTCDKMSILPLNPDLFSPSLRHLWQDQGSLGELPWTCITWTKYSRKVRLWEFLLLKDTLYGTMGKKGGNLELSNALMTNNSPALLLQNNPPGSSIQRPLRSQLFSLYILKSCQVCFNCWSDPCLQAAVSLGKYLAIATASHS